MRRFLIATAGLLIFSIGGRYAADTSDGTTCPLPASPIAEATLLAIESENGCLDEAPPADESWPPGWDTARIAGGDVPPARVVSDPFPTFHSVVVDPEHELVFFSDPNRHALWSYDRRAASKAREAVEARTSVRGPATGR